MMPTTLALLWEFWRSIRGRLLLALCVMAVLPSLLTLSQLPPNIWTWTSRDLRPMPLDGQMAVIWLDFVICILFVGYGVGYPLRHYTLPIPTLQLTLVRLLPGAVACSGMHIVVAAVFNFIARSELPYAGPALSYAMGYVFGYSAVSLVYGRENLRTLVGLSAGILSLFWVFGHYDNRLSFGREFRWPAVSVLEIVIVGFIAVIAGWVAYRGFTRSRKGLGWAPFRMPVERSLGAGDSLQLGAHRFSSTFAALFWREWRQDGWLWPLAMLCTSSIVAGIAFVSHIISPSSDLPSDRSSDILGSTGMFIFFGSVMPWFVGVVTTDGRRSQSNRPLSTSLSTLPVSDATLAWVSIARSLASIVVSAVCVTLVGFTWATGYSLLGIETEWTAIDWGRGFPTWYRALAGAAIWWALFAWFSTAVGTATGLSGRRLIAFSPIFFIPLSIGLLAVLSLLDRQTFEFVTLFGGTFLLVALVFGTVIAYIFAWNRNVISKNSVILGLVILVTVESSLIFASLEYSQQTTPGVSPLSLIGLCQAGMFLALAAAPPAVVPLAVHYNRHR